MAVTKTESAMGLLNYSCSSRQGRTDNGAMLSDSYVTAMKQIIDIYGNVAKARGYNEVSIEDFNEQVSCTKYLDNRDLYPGIDTLTTYSRQVTSEIALESQNQMVR